MRLLLPTLAVVILTLSSCGASRDAVAVRVDGLPITEKAVEHWTAVEAVLAYEADPTGPVPVGVVPDPPSYANCIAYLRRTGASLAKAANTGTTAAQLKQRCHQRYDQLRRHVLDILITNSWFAGEAGDLGITVSNQEVQQAIARHFATRAAFRRFQELTGETRADQISIVRSDLLSAKLQGLLQRKVIERGLAPRQAQLALAKLGAEFTARWTARTDCRAGYVVQKCRQFKAPHS